MKLSLLKFVSIVIAVATNTDMPYLVSQMQSYTNVPNIAVHKKTWKISKESSREEVLFSTEKIVILHILQFSLFYL